MRFKYNKAFSLIEVLITVAILSTTVIFLFRSFTTSLATTRFAERMTLACYLAENKIWEIQQAYANDATLSQDGYEIMQGTRFGWKYRITESVNPKLKELITTVSWKERAKEKEYTMDFYTYLLPKP
ncbi:MAG: type II secretion system minor pseudopilin GspI [Candidatus Omnitrophota bacterium]